MWFYYFSVIVIYDLSMLSFFNILFLLQNPQMTIQLKLIKIFVHYLSWIFSGIMAYTKTTIKLFAFYSYKLAISIVGILIIFFIEYIFIFPVVKWSHSVIVFSSTKGNLIMCFRFNDIYYLWFKVMIVVFNDYFRDIWYGSVMSVKYIIFYFIL